MTPNPPLELQVITDDLTGLYNRRYLNIKLREETERSERQKTRFGLIMLDLDHFKEVNDNYGHDEGDQALLWIADILCRSVRKCDFVIRFAGDEFFLILPGAGIKESRVIARRIYANIEHNPFRGSRGQVTVPVGISGGIAIFPDDAASVSDLMKASDRGLYLAKEQGRGKTCLASDARRFRERKIDRADLLTPPFTGRKHEQQKLKEAWSEVNRTGTSQVFVIRGESGMGKSRLVAEFLNELRPPAALALSSFCLPHEIEIPYQPIIDLLNQWIEKDKNDYEKHYSTLPGKEQRELLKLIPNFEIPAGDLPGGPGFQDSTTDNSRLYYGIANLFKSTAREHPLILVIEDLQWIDAAAMDMLTHILNQASETPILTLLSVQPVMTETFRHTEISRFLRILGRETRFSEIALAPLQNRHIQQIVRRIFKPEKPDELALVEEILCREAEGNPLFVKELLLKIVEEKILVFSSHGWMVDPTRKLTTPDRILDVVKDRVELMEEDLKNMLRQASVIGKEFLFEILRQVSGKNEGHLLDLLDKALAQGFLEEKADSRLETYRFSSLQVQKLLYDRFSSARKRRIHHQVMRILETEFHNKRGDYIQTMFFHAQKAGEHLKSFLYGCQGAHKAFQSYGFREAVQYFHQSLESYTLIEDTQKDVYCDLYRRSLFAYGETLIQLGRYDDAKKVLSRLPSSPEQKELAGFIAFKKGSYTEAQALYEEAFRESDRRLLKSRIQSRLADVRVNQGDYETAGKHAFEALLLADAGKNIEMQALALKTLGKIQFSQNQWNDSLRYYRQSLKQYTTLDDRSGIASCLNNIGLIHDRLRRYLAAERCFLKAKTICDEIGFHSLNLLILNNLGSLFFDTGRLTQAEGYFTRCLELSEDTGEVSAAIASYANLGSIFQSADPDKSEFYNLRGLELCRKIGEKSKESYFYNVLGDIALAKNDLESGEQWYRKAILYRRSLGEIENEIFSGIKLLELLEKKDDAEKFREIADSISVRFKETEETHQGRMKQLKEEFRAVFDRAASRFDLSRGES